jgi:hypothetical protein
MRIGRQPWMREVRPTRQHELGDPMTRANRPTRAPMQPTKAWAVVEGESGSFIRGCWRDDAQIVDQRVSKVYSETGWTGVEIEIKEIVP